MQRNVPCLLASLWLAIFLAACSTTPPVAVDTQSVDSVAVAPTLISRNGMVAAANPLAARAGAEILARGGNAVDAAIAVSLALGVVEPYASGLGGEGFMVAVMADGREVSIDFRSAAPGLATYENLDGAGGMNAIRYTPKAYCVAGVPAGIDAALEMASMPLSDLAGPAIRLAEEGFEVNETFASVNMDRWEVLFENAPEFLNDGMPWSAGETYRNPALARTLRRLAAQGADDFYRGELAESLDRFMRENGGWARKSDLSAYRAYRRTPRKGSYRGFELIVPGSPVGGPRVLATLNILEHFNLGIMDWDDPLAVHLMQEAMILTSLDQRRWIGDPETNDYIPEQGYVSKQYARERAMMIDLSTASDPGTWHEQRTGDPGPYESGAGYVDVMLAKQAAEASVDEPIDPSPSTTHFSVVDRDGNAVAWTQTVSSFFGTGNMVDGYFLNNELVNFKSRPVVGSPINLEPGRRPRTTIAPMVVREDGELRWVLGSPGGGRIGSTVIEILVNLIDFEMSLEEAIRTPKFTGYDSYPSLNLENAFPERTVDFLEMMGHVVKEYEYPDLYFGGPNAIEAGEDGTLTGVGSIRRKGGAAAPVNRGENN